MIGYLLIAGGFGVIVGHCLGHKGKAVDRMSLHQWDNINDLHHAEKSGWGEESKFEELEDYQGNALHPGHTYWLYQGELFDEDEALEFLDSLGATQVIN